MVSGTTGDKRKYVVKANRLPRSEEELNVDLPAYFRDIYKEDDPRPRWLFVKGPTSKAYHKSLYEKIERFYQLARPCGILQPVKFQFVSRFLNWIKNDFFYHTSELILATLIQRYDKKERETK